MSVYPYIGAAVPLLAITYHQWERHRIRRDLPQLEQLAAVRRSAARAYTGIVAAFLLLAMGGALLYGDDPGSWVIVLVDAAVAVWAATRARWWLRAAGRTR